MKPPTAKVPASSYFCLLLCIAVFVGTQLLPETIQQLLHLERNKITHGQWWRLVSAHFVHLSWFHLLLNGLLLILFHQFYGPILSWLRWAIWLTVLSVIVSLGILWGNPTIDWYVGFSGVVSGLFVAGAFLTRRQMPLISCGVLIVVGAQIGYEQFSGKTIAVSSFSEIPTVVDAHLYGAAGGMVCWLMEVLIRAVRGK